MRITYRVCQSRFLRVFSQDGASWDRKRHFADASLLGNIFSHKSNLPRKKTRDLKEILPADFQKSLIPYGLRWSSRDGLLIRRSLVRVQAGELEYKRSRAKSRGFFSCLIPKIFAIWGGIFCSVAAIWALIRVHFGTLAWTKMPSSCAL